MPSPNEPVKPTPFDAASTAPTPDTTPAAPAAESGSPAWVLPALLGLVALAVVVIFFWQPGSPDDAPDTTPVAESAPADRPPAARLTQPEPRGPEATPWSDAQAARLRKEAQDVLEQLLDVQFTLEERGVTQWAPEAFAAAQAFAQQGDELYKTREFEAATARYRQGLEAMQTLETSIPEVFRDKLEQARLAIEAGDADTAAAELAMAAIIDQDSGELAELQQRLTLVPQVQALRQQALEATESGDLEAAEALLEQAAALDPKHLAVAEELRQAAEAAQNYRFNAAMSEGYAALDAGQFDSARKSFRRAASLQAGSSEAASALIEVDTAQEASRLGSLKRQGARAEQNEQWADAVTAYEKALKLDPSVLFATEGLQQARERAAIDQQLETTLADPLRLSDTAVAETAENLLDRARKISPKGPRLQRQISAMDTTLKQAATPVTVSLVSDGQTEVIVYKVARLGTFQQRELTLRPGTYVAVGSRNGYRDVRHSFTVRHDSTPQPLTIICTETI